MICSSGFSCWRRRFQQTGRSVLRPRSGSSSDRKTAEQAVRRGYLPLCWTHSFCTCDDVPALTSTIKKGAPTKNKQRQVGHLVSCSPVALLWKTILAMLASELPWLSGYNVNLTASDVLMPTCKLFKNTIAAIGWRHIRIYLRQTGAVSLCLHWLAPVLAVQQGGWAAADAGIPSVRPPQFVPVTSRRFCAYDNNLSVTPSYKNTGGYSFLTNFD